MKFINFMNSLLINLIFPKIQSCPKFLVRHLCSKCHFSLITSWIPANEGLEFKLDSLKSRNSLILLIDIINFKLRLIEFVYIILRHPV